MYKRQGYTLLINETQFNTITADEIGSIVVSRQADGIILLAAMSPFGTRVLSAKSQRALPMVIGCETVSPELNSYPGIHIDNISAAREATNYLLELGHDKIAFIYGEHKTLLTMDRERGYREAMREAGKIIDNGWVVEGGLTLDGAIDATDKLLAQPNPPTAIFCANDEMAMGCLHAVKDAGLDVPGDISVIGFDDNRYARVMDPPLTTIAQPAEKIGQRVMERLLKEIENGRSKNAEPEIVPHELVIRASSAAPRSD